MTEIHKKIKEALDVGEGQRIEFKQQINDKKLGNTICAFANSDGGEIYVGITDKGESYASRVIGIQGVEDAVRQAIQLGKNCDPSVPIITQTIPTAKAHVLIITIDKMPEDTSYKGLMYERRGNQNQAVSVREIKQRARTELSGNFDSAPCSVFNYLDDFDTGKFLSFIGKPDSTSEQGNIANLLRSLGAAEPNREQLIMRNAGVLLFAKDLSKFHHHAFISCTKRREAGKLTTVGGWGNDWGRSWGTRSQQMADNTVITDKKRFDKDLISSVEGAMTFLENHLNLSHEFTNDSMKRKEVLEIPPLALREALVNAVVHRDYSDSGQNVFVKVYDDRVEIVNPGGFMPGMDNKNFREFSQRRNPIIARLMGKAAYVEGEATGITKMEELTTKAGLPVKFIIDAYRWRVCFPRKNYHRENAEHSFNFNDKSLSSRRALRLAKVLYGIYAGKFTKDEYAKHLGVATRTITEDLKYLTSKKLIAFSGSNHTGCYVVTKKFLQRKH